MHLLFQRLRRLSLILVSTLVINNQAGWAADTESITPYFSKPKSVAFVCLNLVMGQIGSMEKGDTIKIAMYQINNSKILDSISTALDKGVNIQIVMDKENYEKEKDKGLKKIQGLIYPLGTAPIFDKSE